MRAHRVLLVMLTAGLAGCYAYVPSSPQEVQPGQSIRLRLTPEEAASLQDLRLTNPRLLEGTLLESGSAGWVLEAMVGGGPVQAGAASRTLVQRVSVPSSGVLEVELKELDKVRTGLLVGGGGAVLLAVIAKAGGGSGTEDGPGTDVPEARRIPLIRFGFPIGR